MIFLRNALLLFLLISCASPSNENTKISDKTTEKVVLISGQSSSGDCSRKAIRITENLVQFDDCYDEDTKVFTSDHSIPLSENTLYKSIFLTQVEQWRMIETQTDKVADVNSGLPFVIDLTSNGTTESVIIIRTGNYTDNRNHFMYDIENVFDNWDLITSHLPTK